MNDKYLTVSQINKYIKYKFDTDSNLKLVYLKGEISNFKSHTTGHLYFTLKDESSRILAVMFRSNASKISFKPCDGTNVLVVGRISTYEANGNYQIYVEEMVEDGVGNLYKEFEKLKVKLEAKGYFDEKHKKPIPKFPKRIGVITASTGAAIRDIITTIERRYRLAEVILLPCLVQGEGAKDDIVRNLELAASMDFDVIILGRGGGSIEDLWAFNEEIVADAIFNMDVPIISAVGHEIDFTISDFVSDLRAPTPTAAAELAVCDTAEIINSLKQYKTRFSKAIEFKLNFNKNRLDSVMNSYVLKNPMNIYEPKMQKLDNLIEKMCFLVNDKISKGKSKCENLSEKLNDNIKLTVDNKGYLFVGLLGKLETLSPIKTLARGYSITTYNGKVITDLSKLEKDMIVETEFVDGFVVSKITEVRNGKE